MTYSEHELEFMFAKNDAMLKAAVHYSRVTCLSAYRSSLKQKKLCHRLFQTSFWLISYSGERCNINCIIITSQTLITWSAFRYNDGSDKQGGDNRVPDRLLERATMVFKVTDMLNSWWLTDVHNQRRLGAAMELCTIIERRALSNWFFSVLWFLWTRAKYI